MYNISNKASKEGKNMAIATVQLNFRIPEELYDKLQAAAEAEEKSKTEIVRRALEAYLEKKN